MRVLILALLFAASAAAQDRAPVRDAGGWFHTQRAYPSGQIPESALSDAMSQRLALERRVYAARTVRERQVTSPWTEIGPAGVNGPEGVESGHVSAIVVDPRNPETMYVAASGGGVWHSTDGGATWRPLTDHLPSLISGSLALDQRTGTLYYGTGEMWGREWGGLYGGGVFRSHDAGRTWITSNGWDTVANRANFSGGITPRIVLHPSDARTIFAGRNSGLWRSVDGGETWVRLLAGFVTDVVIDSNNASRVFAALGHTSGDAANGVYRSTDAGASWERVSGLPGGTEIARISMSHAPSNPAVMYATFERTSDRQLFGAYRSLDGGATWARIPAPNTLFDSAGRGQGYFNSFVAVHPRDPGIVYFGGVELWKSTDAGESWRTLSIRDGRRLVHEDQFCLAFHPNNSETIFVGNEGGIYRSSDGGNNWQNLNTGLSITQFNSVAVHPQDPLTVVGGTQGQGLVRFRGSSVWEQLFRGDGGQVSLDGNRIFTTRQRLQPMISRDGGAAFSNLAGGFDSRDRVSFYPPLAADPANSSVLYYGTHRLWMSSNGGISWSAVTGDVTNGGTITAVTAGAGLVFTGSSDGLIATRDAQGTIRFGSGIPNRWITAVAVAPGAASPLTTTAYLTVSGFGSGHVFRSADGGWTWTDISGNLPDAPASSVAVDPQGIVYVATDVGVFRSEDGASWTSFNTGLPNTFVMALALDAGSRTLTAATYGRGVHQIRLQDAQTGPNVMPGGVVSAANFQNAIAPGMIATVFGTRLAGGSVTVNGQQAPVFFVSSSQINFQVPFEVTGPAVVQVTTAEGFASVTVPVLAAAPGIFAGSILHGGSAARVAPANPAVAGEILSVFATGLGATTTPVATGAVSPSNPPAAVRATVTATIGGRGATVLFSGLAPGFTGLYQVNVQVPTGITGDDLPLVITAGGRASNSVNLAVR